MDTLVAAVYLRTPLKRILALDVLLEQTWKSSDVINFSTCKGPTIQRNERRPFGTMRVIGTSWYCVAIEVHSSIVYLQFEALTVFLAQLESLSVFRRHLPSGAIWQQGS